MQLDASARLRHGIAVIFDLDDAVERATVGPTPRPGNSFDQLHRSIRYDTRCYFNVRSKANMSQLNLRTARNRQLKSVKTEKLKVEYRNAQILSNNSKQSEESM